MSDAASDLKFFEVVLYGTDAKRDFIVQVRARWWPEAKQIAEQENPGYKAVSAEEVGADPPAVSRAARVIAILWRWFFRATIIGFPLGVLYVWASFAYAGRERTKVIERDYAIIAAVFNSPRPRSLKIAKVKARDHGMLQGEPYAWYQATMDAGEFNTLLANVVVERENSVGFPASYFIVTDTDVKKMSPADITYMNAAGMTSFAMWRPFYKHEVQEWRKMIAEYEKQGYPANALERYYEQLRDGHDKDVMLGTVHVDDRTSPKLTLYVRTTPTIIPPEK